MKLNHLFLITHAAAAGAATVLFIAASRSGNADSLIISTALSLFALGAASWYAAARVINGLSNLELVVADQDACETLSSGLIEIDQSAEKIAADAARWETVAANNREQARDFQSMMFLLNRRGPDRPATSGQLRGLLAGLGNTLHGHISTIETSSAEVEQNAQSILAGCEAQSDTVIMTTAHLEQLCAAIELVLATAIDLEKSNESLKQITSETKTSVHDVSSGYQKVRDESQSCEKKLRALCDPVQQINGIVETISDVAARTDLLALNASIEAVRAGENGKQFAKVADEVRKLAEQSTDASREIASLLDSIQLVTQESLHQMARGRDGLEAQIDAASAAENSLLKICSTVDNGALEIRQIRESTGQQLQLAQNVVVALETIADVAKTSRADAENIAWQSKSTLNTPGDFANAIKRLRQCDGAVIVEESEREDLESPDDAVPVAPVAAPRLTTDLALAE